jgi:uncharacterized integral membrane protein
VFSGTGIYASVVVGFLLAAALVILVGQNTHRVVLSWLPWSITVPLGAVALAAVLAGSLVTIVVGLAWRRSARRILSEREELKRWRAAGKPPARPDGAEAAAQPDNSAQLAASGGSGSARAR